MTRKFRTSPNFSLNHSADGRCFVAGEVEPYPQYWLSERERLLFALFGKRGGLGEGDAIEALLRLVDAADEAGERKRIERAIAGMIEAGVLIDPTGELSRYGKAMAADYLKHRPFPTHIAARIVESARIGPESRVLDLASGPGSLALELASTTQHVSIMELSRGFVSAAKAEAKRRGLQLDAHNESCNRLAQHDGSYQAITISQALHWLDDVALCKGICRTLAPQGSFLVVHGSLTLPDSHPLSYILGDHTPLGDKQKIAFAEEVRPMFRRLALLFEALDTPEVARHDPEHARRGMAPIRGQGIELFRQHRPIGEGFARAFLSDRHIEGLGQDRDMFWRHLKARCDAASPDELIATQEWALLHFRRGASGFSAESWQPTALKEIAFP